jgi:hypothetical protein
LFARLRQDDVQWRVVQGVYDQCDPKAEGLTEDGAAVIAANLCMSFDC